MAQIGDPPQPNRRRAGHLARDHQGYLDDRAKHGDDGQPVFGSVSCEVHGECVEMFDNNDELEKALDERNVLHCGSGDMRFEV